MVVVVVIKEVVGADMIFHVVEEGGILGVVVAISEEDVVVLVDGGVMEVVTVIEADFVVGGK